MTSGDTITPKQQNKNHLRTCHMQLLTDAWQTKKGLTKLISLNSVRPFLSVSHILPDNHRILDK